MDRELLLEIGCEEIPAGWLPALTNQVGEIVDAQLRAHRLPPESPVETYSTPRRLTVRVVRIPERQTDLEELVNGPPVSASFKPDGSPTPAAAGFAAKQGVDVGALERIHTPKGEYLAFRKRQRGKATVDVLPDVLRDTLRGLPFPKAMRWDAMLEDGRGELLFGRPIRWMLYLYGGRVVPFTITRTPAAQTSQVQDVPTGAVTYGHRFLTTSGRAGRAIKVRSFDEYRARLLENFVILERAERHNKIARELDAKAQRLQGRVSRTVNHETGLLVEVPDLVEYPSVVAGTFALEFLELPEEVLTTTLIHHQHYFPVEGEDGKLKNAFLAVINTEPDNERTIARNAERVVSARLRDARFFWEADRQIPLESRIGRLGTLLFHKKLGTYKEKAERIERLAEWIAAEALGADAATAKLAGKAARLAKADLATDMVREFTELQGTMGGVYARAEGQPEAVWKAIYFHYLPIGVEADAPPTRAQLGAAAVTWAAVSLADKLDTIVGLFAAGEKPTGSRDPYGLRRAAHGVFRILVDLPALTGVNLRP
ncbi:MAG: glyS, partial [Acidobacteria bacterium]|nr:glyS [Acidobacteriota bacterium]